MNLRSGGLVLSVMSKRNKEIKNVKHVRKLFKIFHLSLPILSWLYFLLFPGTSFAVGELEKALQISVLAKPFADNEREKYKLQIRQPYRLDPTILMKAMSSLAYQRRGVSWSNKRRVFTTSTIRDLAPRIVEQFALANPDERVFFQLKNRLGKTLLRGDTFIAEDGMHWRLTVIQRLRRKVDDFSISGEPWRLVPLSRQSYKTKQRYKGLIEDITNWVVLKKLEPEPDRILPPSPARLKQGASEVPSRLDIKERLRVLEDLKKEGMIDDEEYQNKRREILKDL